MAGPEWNAQVNYEINASSMRLCSAASYNAGVHAGPRNPLADFSGQVDLPFPHRSERSIFRRHTGDGDDVVASWHFLIDKTLQDLFF